MKVGMRRFVGVMFSSFGHLISGVGLGLIVRLMWSRVWG